MAEDKGAENPTCGSREKRISDYILAALISLLFALFTLLALKVSSSGGISGNFAENRIADFQPVDFLLFVVFAAAYFGVLYLVGMKRNCVSRFIIRNTPGRFSPRVVWIASSCIMLAAWLVYLIAFCPGSVLADSFSSINQALEGSYDNHHPVLYSLLVGIFVKAGLVCGNINYGVFAYSLFQSFALAATAGYVIRLMYECRARMGWLVAALVFFCITPFFPTYAIIMWKDPLFSCALAWLSFILIRFAIDEKTMSSPWMLVVLGIDCLLVMFLRNNGVLVVPAVGLCLLIAYRKKAKLALAVMGATVIIAAIIQGPLYHALDIAKPSVEAFGIPIQQIAYVISEDPDALSQEQKEVADSLMPYDRWSEYYAPFLVDTIKWAPEFDASYLETHRAQVIGLWIELLASHPVSCLKAYALATLGFWHPYYQDAYGYIDTYILENEYGIAYSDILGNEETQALRDALESAGLQIGSGVFVWMMLAGLALAWASDRREKVLFYLPGFFCWMSILIATPVAFSLRYVYILALLAPLYFVVPFSRNGDRCVVPAGEPEDGLAGESTSEFGGEFADVPEDEPKGESAEGSCWQTEEDASWKPANMQINRDERKAPCWNARE